MIAFNTEKIINQQDSIFIFIIQGIQAIF